MLSLLLLIEYMEPSIISSGRALKLKKLASAFSFTLYNQQLIHQLFY